MLGGWSCGGGQAVDPVVDVLFPPTHRPGTFTAQTERRRKRPLPLPTPNRGPAQPGDLQHLRQSHHPPTPRRRHRPSMADTRLPVVVSFVPHPHSHRSHSLPRSPPSPSNPWPPIRRDRGACCRNRTYPRQPPTRSRIHPPVVAHPPPSGRASGRASLRPGLLLAAQREKPLKVTAGIGSELRARLGSNRRLHASPPIVLGGTRPGRGDVGGQGLSPPRGARGLLAWARSGCRVAFGEFTWGFVGVW